jgi:hypothetical protein
MSRELTNQDDLIDSREVMDRIEDLQHISPADLTQDEEYELLTLRELAKEGENACGDWSYGATLVRDSYFVDYAQQLAEDIGAVERVSAWPASCIDWRQAATELQIDYYPVDYDGVTYWVR